MTKIGRLSSKSCCYFSSDSSSSCFAQSQLTQKSRSSLHLLRRKSLRNWMSIAAQMVRFHWKKWHESSTWEREIVPDIIMELITFLVDISMVVVTHKCARVHVLIFKAGFTLWFFLLSLHTFLLKIMFRIASSITTRTKVWISDDNIALPAYQHAGANSEYKGYIPRKVLKNKNYKMRSSDNKYQSWNSVEEIKSSING